MVDKPEEKQTEERTEEKIEEIKPKKGKIFGDPYVDLGE